MKNSEAMFSAGFGSLELNQEVQKKNIFRNCCAHFFMGEFNDLQIAGICLHRNRWKKGEFQAFILHLSDLECFRNIELTF